MEATAVSVILVNKLVVYIQASFSRVHVFPCKTDQLSTP